MPICHKSNCLTALYFRILNCPLREKRATTAISIFSRRGTLSVVTTACWPKQALFPLTGWQPINTPTRSAGHPVKHKRRVLSSIPGALGPWSARGGRHCAGSETR